MNNNRITLVLALAVAFLLGGWIGDETREKPQRPVLTWIARVARWGLWMMVVADEQPQPMPFKAIDADHIDHARSL